MRSSALKSWITLSCELFSVLWAVHVGTTRKRVDDIFACIKTSMCVYSKTLHHLTTLAVSHFNSTPHNTECTVYTNFSKQDINILFHFVLTGNDTGHKLTDSNQTVECNFQSSFTERERELSKDIIQIFLYFLRSSCSCLAIICNLF